MKKIIITCTIIFLLLMAFLIGNINTKHQTSNKKITIAEVAHSIFYAPQYLADSLGYFKEEGLEVEIILANGADAVMSAVLSNEADIGFCGTEATIYVADKKLFQNKQ